ncbi:MAG TPA: shikimate dehydrogenase [Permianibacter sp.]|nr:shikimate dehydrogenase [Permianibacter sp.]
MSLPEAHPAANSPVIRCAVIGQPIQHSKSPPIHLAFASQFGLLLQYDRIDASPAAFADTVRAFFAGGGLGLSVTLPHKTAALALADDIGERARRAGAANTLGRDASGRIWADNTDGIGLVNDLQRLALPIHGRRVLLLGAGGAAAGVIPALLDAKPALLALRNRTPVNAVALLDRHADPRLRLARDDDAPYELVISTVSEGAAALLTDMPLAASASGYDLNYGERAAATLCAMREHGLNPVHDGRGMLIEQAAAAFARWHNCQPDTAPLHRNGF